MGKQLQFAHLFSSSFSPFRQTSIARGEERDRPTAEASGKVLFRIPPPLSPSLQATIIGRKLHGNWLLEGGGGGSIPPPNQEGVNYIPRKRVSLSPPSSSSSKAAQPDKKGTFMDHFCVESLRRHKTVFLPLSSLLPLPPCVCEPSSSKVWPGSFLLLFAFSQGKRRSLSPLLLFLQGFFLRRVRLPRSVGWAGAGPQKGKNSSPPPPPFLSLTHER